jgi:hypothetical protein
MAKRFTVLRIFSGMSISARLAASFGIQIIILTVLGYVGWSRLATIGAKVENAQQAEHLIQLSATGQLVEKGFMLRPDPSRLQIAARLVEQSHEAAALL